MLPRYGTLALAVTLALGSAALALHAISTLTALTPASNARIDVAVAVLAALALAFGAALGVSLLRPLRALRTQTIELADRVHDLGVLVEASRMLSTTFDRDRIAAIVAAEAVKIAKSTHARVALVDERTGSLAFVGANPGVDPLPHTDDAALRDCPMVRAVLTDGRASSCGHDPGPSSQQVTPCAACFDERTRPSVVVPIRAGGATRGLVLFGERRGSPRGSFPPERIAICEALADQAGVALANAASFAAIEATVLGVISAMSNAIDAKSRWTFGHSQRVAAHAVAIGERLGLDEETVKTLYLGCLLHDVGKIGTHDAILDKPDRLTDDEFEEMKLHPAVGVAILASVPRLVGVLPVVHHHHERWDGRGYPDGLRGEETPLIARIAAVADAYDAMTAQRPYRETPGRERAIAELGKCAGSQFEPALADVFAAILEESDS